MCECVCAAVTACGSQEKKGMFRLGEGRGTQWHSEVGRKVLLHSKSTKLCIACCAVEFTFRLRGLRANSFPHSVSVLISARSLGHRQTADTQQEKPDGSL